MKMTCSTFFLILACLVAPGIASAQFWEPTPGPYGGEVLSFETTLSGDFLAGTIAAGLFRSTDDGITWTPASFPVTQASILTIVREPGSSFILASTQNFLYRSTDDGLTWTSSNVGSQPNAARSLVYQPSTAYWYAATWWDGVYRSTDMGISWSQVNNGLTDIAMTSIELDETGAVILAATGSSGVFRSTNSGATWIETNTGLNNFQITDLRRSSGACFVSTHDGIYKINNSTWNWSHVTDPGVAVYSLYSDSLSSDLFAGTMPGLLHSTDGGANWSSYGVGLPFLMYPVQALARKDNGTMLAGLPGPGIYRSADGGAHWTRSTVGILAQNIPALAADAAGSIYAGTEHGMLYRSTDNGATWDSLFNVSSPIRQILPAGQKVYFRTWGTGVRMSTDGGTTFSTNSMTEAVGVLIKALAGDPSSGELFIGMGDGVYRTTDDGANWEKVNNGLLDSNVTSLFVTTAGRLFCGTGSGLVFTSSNHGANWIRADSGVTSGGNVWCFAQTTNKIFVGTGLGVYSTADSGKYWEQAGLNSTTIFDVEAAKNSQLFACTYQGPYRSTNGGSTWEKLADGFVGNSARSFAVSTDGYAFVSTDGTGIYRSVQKVVTAVRPEVTNTPRQFVLEQNYPNPFNPVTTIHYTVGGTRDLGPALSGAEGLGTRKTMIVVYDLLGRQVATLVDEAKAPGSYEVRFDGSGLASGVYIYRISAGSFVQSRRMVLLK